MPPRTVLLTGITGFIGKRIALDLLESGHFVVGSLRSLSRKAEVQQALRQHLRDERALQRLKFLPLELTRDEGWAAATKGVDAVLHTASPCPLAEPRDEAELIQPAVDGTLRMLEAARLMGVHRVILTSSLDAVMHGAKSEVCTEADWSDLAAPSLGAYAKSKVLAERAAWAFADRHPEMQLTVINPGLVQGEPLDQHFGSSVAMVQRLYMGKDPMVADLHMPVVDLADVSRAHLRALERDETIGRRYICADRSMAMVELARLVKAAHPARPVPTRVAPTLLVRTLALFDAEVRRAVPLLGRRIRFDNSRAQRELGISFVPAERAVLASAHFVSRLAGAAGTGKRPR